MSQVLPDFVREILAEEAMNHFTAEELAEGLITETDEPVDNIFSAKQQRLLTETLYSSWTPPMDEEKPNIPRPFFADANIGVYFTRKHNPFVPDVLLSLDVTAPENMFSAGGKCYMVWEFGKAPDVVVEIVSNKTGGELDHKLREYARGGVRYYVVHDPMQLLSNDVLRVYEPGIVGRYYLRDDYQLPSLELSLTLWHGDFENTEANWLRWSGKNGELLLTPDEKFALQKERTVQERERAEQERERAEQERERAEQERERAEQERERAKQERERAEQERERAEQEVQLRINADNRAAQAEERARLLTEKLREAGIDPNQL